MGQFYPFPGYLSQFFWVWGVGGKEESWIPVTISPQGHLPAVQCHTQWDQGTAGKGEGGEQCTGPGMDQQGIEINYIIMQLY